MNMHPRRSNPIFHDEIQERVIAQAHRMGLTPAAIATQTNGKVTEHHIRAYIERRSGMTTSKVQHLFRILRLEIKPVEVPPDELMENAPLKKCANALCDRLTTAAFCCGACSAAFEGKYEIHEHGPLAHSKDCDERHARRLGIPREW